MVVRSLLKKTSVYPALELLVEGKAPRLFFESLIELDMI